jgi:hypothetical protein
MSFLELNGAEMKKTVQKVLKDGKSSYQLSEQILIIL